MNFVSFLIYQSLLKGFPGFEDFTSSKVSFVPEKAPKLYPVVICCFAEVSNDQIHMEASKWE